MSIKISNDDTSLKTNNIISNQVKVAKVESDVEIKSWEAFKKIDGLNTDFLNKPIGIPSTAFTPNLVLPTKAYLENVYRAFNLLSGIQKKATQLANIFDKTSDSISRKDIVKKTIALSTKGY